jgi:hypothetical protein
MVSFTDTTFIALIEHITQYWILVERWQKWCKENGAEAVRVANQEG